MGKFWEEITTIFEFIYSRETNCEPRFITKHNFSNISDQVGCIVQGAPEAPDQGN